MALLEESWKVSTEFNRRITENYVAPLNNPLSLNLSVRVKTFREIVQLTGTSRITRHKKFFITATWTTMV
jgi:hypothetical protein